MLKEANQDNKVRVKLTGAKDEDSESGDSEGDADELSFSCS